MRRFAVFASLLCTIFTAGLLAHPASAQGAKPDTATERSATSSPATTSTHGMAAIETAHEDPTAGEESFEAHVVQILDTRQTEKDGVGVTQQNLKLRGLDGNWKGKEMEFRGIGDVELFGANTYKVGDRVLVQRSQDPESGEDIFFVVDYVRRGWLYTLAALFLFVIFMVAGIKGLRALLSLLVSFAIIMGVLVPLILAGWSPVPVAVIVCTAMFVGMVYITEGFNRKSHLAIASIGLSLLLVGLLSLFFTWITRLTGTAQEETMFLTGLTKQAVNFRGLLLAGILLGTLGVLDDVVIGQIESVTQIRKANPYLPWKKVFAMSMEVGKAHLGSMVNTLFLAYAGASMPLLLLFSIKQPPFVNFSQAINNEMIATEIIRTLLGSLGIALSMPIATYLAVKSLVASKQPSKNAP